MHVCSHRQTDEKIEIFIYMIPSVARENSLCPQVMNFDTLLPALKALYNVGIMDFFTVNLHLELPEKMFKNTICKLRLELFNNFQIFLESFYKFSTISVIYTQLSTSLKVLSVIGAH